MTAAVTPVGPADTTDTKSVGEIREIPARMLTVDHSVQRSLDKARAGRIAGEFNPNALGTLVVSHRNDGSYHIIDGAHRHAALMLLGLEDEPVRCDVHTGLSRQKEAAMFRLLNNSRQVAVIDKFLVRIQEEDPIAVSINAALEEQGWKVSTSKLDGHFVAVSSIEKVFRRAGERGRALVEWVITVATEAWGMDANGVRGEIITGLGLVFLRHDEAVDTKKLIDELKLIPGGPLVLVGRAKSLKEFRRGKLADAMAEILVNLVNNKRRVNRLPAWREELPVG